MLNRTIAPLSRDIDALNLLRPDHFLLSNGCPVYCFNSGEQELVRIEFIFDNLRFDPKKVMLNPAVNTLLIEGTSSLTAAQIADRVDFYGAFLQTEYGFDRSELTLLSLNKHLHHTLPVIKAILTDAIFPEKEVQTYIRNQQQKLQVSLEKNDFVARRNFSKAVFGNTAYALGPESADFDALKREDLLTHFKQQYQPSNCTIVLSGKLDDHVLELVKALFDSDWKDQAAADVSQPEIVSAEELLLFTEKADSLQSAIRMGTKTITRSHADFPGLQVLNTVLGGYFGSRLMANIREDKGYTYGIGSGVISYKHAGVFVIASEVGAEVCKATIDEIEKEINILKTELIPEEELDLIRNFMLGSMLGDMDDVFSHADKFKNIYFSGLDYSYYDRYTQVVKNISAQELMHLANTYLDFDGLCKVVVGKYELA
ncbi:MAG: M16 family metallopeptidase [Sphingobacteriaceae bacterium]